jgi:hypothetical protein
VVEWLWVAYTGFVIALGASAGVVALRTPEDQPDRRRTALDIVKLTAGAGTGAAAVLELGARLAEAGLL